MYWAAAAVLEELEKNGWNVNHLEKINAFSVVLQTPVTKLVHDFHIFTMYVYAINLFGVLSACSQALQDIDVLFGGSIIRRVQ